ncbi:hypothetical protein Q7P35_003998 [Cladosporium inversicolor]
MFSTVSRSKRDADIVELFREQSRDRGLGAMPLILSSYIIQNFLLKRAFYGICEMCELLRDQVLLGAIDFATVSVPEVHLPLEFESVDLLPISDINPSSTAEHN